MTPLHLDNPVASQPALASNHPRQTPPLASLSSGRRQFTSLWGIFFISSITFGLACQHPPPRLPSSLEDGSFDSSGGTLSISESTSPDTQEAGSLETESSKNDQSSDEAAASHPSTSDDSEPKSESKSSSESVSTASAKSTSSDESSTSSSPDTTTSSSPDTGNKKPKTVKCQGVLPMTVRDFSTRSHPDFSDRSEFNIQTGLVKPVLSAEGLPIYIENNPNSQITDASSFAQWFKDVKGVNYTRRFKIHLEKMSDNTLNFLDYNFFPLNRIEGWGNEGLTRNFGFTLEIRSHFMFKAGQTFRIEADDDTWVFINNQLVIDLGGVHGSARKSVALDTIGKSLGLEEGSIYSLDIFHAERSPPESMLGLKLNLCLVDS